MFNSDEASCVFSATLPKDKENLQILFEKLKLTNLIKT